MDSGSLVFSVVPEEESLGQKSLDGKQSGTLNGKTTAKKSSRKESKTESLTTPQYSAMCEHSPVKGTPENIEEWLMLSVEDSHANHLVSQEQEKQEMIPEICGQQHWQLSMLSSLPLCSLKTSPDYSQPQWMTNQADLFTTLELFSETWPKAGTMSNGQCWGLMMSEHPTTEKDCGFSEYIPTPNTMEHLPKSKQQQEQMMGGFVTNVGLVFFQGADALMGNGGVKTAGSGLTPSIMRRGMVASCAGLKMWPTPASHEPRLGWQDRENNKKGSQESLTTIVMKSEGRKSGKKWDGGQLNPDWVEWLMGFPIGQTDLKPLEMGKFHSQWLQPMQSYLRSLLKND